MVMIAALTVGLHYYLKKTFTGRALRATTQNIRGAMLVGAWLAVALAVELERSYGMPPILDARIWIAAALPLFGAFLTGSLPPFLRARRAAPASRLEGET